MSKLIITRHFYISCKTATHPLEAEGRATPVIVQVEPPGGHRRRYGIQVVAHNGL